MLLVIVGHIVLGSVHENMLRYVIYAFHMPLFIGLSGYLINAQKLRKSSIVAVFVKYWWRVVLPFSLAFLFFTGLLLAHAYQEERITQALILSYFVTPYYHLWFVPTLLIWVAAYWLLLRLALFSRWTALCFLALSAVWAALQTSSVSLIGPFLTILLSKKVVYFFGFFLFGAWLKTEQSSKLIRFIGSFNILPAVLVMFCAVIYLVNIGPDKEPVKGLAWLMMNVSLIAIAVAWLQQVNVTGKNKSSKGPPRLSNVIVSLGRISLPVYLWHVVPMFLLKGVDFHTQNPLIYYLVSIVTVSFMLILLLALENRSRLLNKLIFGT